VELEKIRYRFNSKTAIHKAKEYTRTPAFYATDKDSHKAFFSGIQGNHAAGHATLFHELTIICRKRV
jgi:hypothetical protein